jgi:hypothetical protein
LARNLEIKYSRILFFDDDLNNIQHTSELGIVGIHVPNGGFNRIVWKEMINNMEVMTGGRDDGNNKKKSRNRNDQDTKIIYPLLEKFENPNEESAIVPIKAIKNRGGNKYKEEKIVGGGEKEEEDVKEDGFMSYYISWLNMFAAIFIAAYWIIKKMN